MKSNRRTLIIGVALLLGMACNTLLPTPVPTPTAVPTNTPLPTATATPIPPTPTPTPIPDYNGVWKGTTSQHKDISITVEKNAVVSVEMEVEVARGSCRTNFSGTLGLNAPITNGAFETSVDVYEGTFAIKGTFDSEDSVSGSLTYTSTGGCPGTEEDDWSATRED